MVVVAGMVPLFTVLWVLVTAVSAENPVDVVSELADDGVYIASSRAGDADPSAVILVIQRAQAEGLTMGILWPSEPQPTTSAFARRVQEAGEMDVVLVFGPDGEFGSFVAEDYEDGSIRAVNAARAAVSPSAKADAFLTGLLEEPVRERPAIINSLVRWIAILLAALVVAAVGEQMIRQYKRSRKRQAFEAAQQS